MAKPRYVLTKPETSGPLAELLVVLWHGAGGDIDEQSLLTAARALAEEGALVARARFPYRRAGRGGPDRMPVLLADQRETLAALRAAHPERRRLLLGGRSMGGRAASMLVAEGFAADGLVFLAYPLHPAGQPAKLRDEHLPAITCPMLFVQGDKDALCRIELLQPVLARLGKRARLALFAGANHSMKKVPPAAIAEAVVGFARRLSQ